LELLITISALGMFSRCIQGVQRLYFLVAELVFLFVVGDAYIYSVSNNKQKTIRCLLPCTPTLVRLHPSKCWSALVQKIRKEELLAAFS